MEHSSSKLILEELEEDDFIKFEDSKPTPELEKSYRDSQGRKYQKNVTPWVTRSAKIRNKALCLHYEILEFFFYIRPGKPEAKKREAIVVKISKLLKVERIIIIYKMFSPYNLFQWK